MDLSKIIDNLYKNFFMRDLLSFFTPGVILVYTILLSHYDWCLIHCMMEIQKISFFFYIPLFFIIYVIGFAIQCWGAEITHTLKFHRYKTHFDFLASQNKFQKGLYEYPYAEAERERFVVLKQMCGNNAWAVFFAAIVAIGQKISFLPNWFDPFTIFTGIIGFLLFFSLIVGHHVHVFRQQAYVENFIKGDGSQKSVIASLSIRCGLFKKKKFRLFQIDAEGFFPYWRDRKTGKKLPRIKK